MKMAINEKNDFLHFVLGTACNMIMIFGTLLKNNNIFTFFSNFLIIFGFSASWGSNNGVKGQKLSKMSKYSVLSALYLSKCALV